jgi:hypothetical protein
MPLVFDPHLGKRLFFSGSCRIYLMADQPSLDAGPVIKDTSTSRQSDIGKASQVAPRLKRAAANRHVSQDFGLIYERRFQVRLEYVDE